MKFSSIPEKKIQESIKIINDHYLVYEDYGATKKAKRPSTSI